MLTLLEIFLGCGGSERGPSVLDATSFSTSKRV